MSRGPEPVKGYDAALPVARARGHVMFFRRERGSTADLMVSGSGVLAIIRLQNAPRLYGTLAEIAREFYDAISRLRLHPAGGPVSRELWLYNRYGVLRFFRVEDAGIVEIGADGSAMPAPVAAPAADRESLPRTKEPAGTEKPAVPENPDGRKCPEEPVPITDQLAVPAGSAGQKCPGDPVARDESPGAPEPAVDPAASGEQPVLPPGPVPGEGGGGPEVG